MANDQNRERERNGRRYKDRDERDFNSGYSMEGENWQDDERSSFQQRSNRDERQSSDWLNRERQGAGHSAQEGMYSERYSPQGYGQDRAELDYGRSREQDWERSSGYGEGQSRRKFDQNYGAGQQGYRTQRDWGWDNFGQQGNMNSGRNYPSGEFVGKGPKGYKRSDERIKEDLSEQLTQHGQIDASEIEVHVQDGMVTLTGTVNNRQAKRLAEDLAESLSGVQDVNNQIRVMREDSGQKNRQSSNQNGQNMAGNARSDVENASATRRNK